MEKLKEFFKSLGLIGLYFIINILMSYLILRFVSSFTLNDNDANVLKSIFFIIGDVILIVFFAFIFRKKLKGTLKDFKNHYKEYLPMCFKYWAVGFTALLVINFIIVFFITGNIAPNEQANRELINIYPLYLIVTVSFTGPILEEMLFRLSFKDVIKGRIPYILTTGIIFALMHVVTSISSPLDLLYILSYSSLGIALSAIYYDTGNIASSMIVHIMHNTLTLFIILNGI